jgi:hypothetical protein
MSHDRAAGKRGARAGRLSCSACEADGQWAARHPQNVIRAQQAIAGNADLRAQYEADPELFLQRFGVAPEEFAAAEGAVRPVSVRPSPIHGQGVFAGQRIQRGDTIARMLRQERDDVSSVASKVNHAEAPNALPVVEGGEMVLKAVEDITPGREVVSRYPFPGK